jgi:uncharacterized protein (TIGR02266 family)
MATGDKRANRRAAVVLRIKLRYTDVDQFISKFAINISRTGLFVRSKTPKRPGTVVAFELRLADGSAVVRGRGEVRWTRELDPSDPSKPYGMGIAFTRLDDESREVIEQMVAHKLETGGREVEGRIPNFPEPEADTPAAPEIEAAAPDEHPPVSEPAPPEAVPEPLPVREPSTLSRLPPLRPEPPRRPRPTVDEVLAEAESQPLAAAANDLESLLAASEVSIAAAVARARQLTRSDSGGGRAAPDKTGEDDDLAALLSPRRPPVPPPPNGAPPMATAEADRVVPLREPETKLGLGPPMRPVPPRQPSSPGQNLPGIAPLDDDPPRLSDTDSDIEAALQNLDLGDDDEPPRKVPSFRHIEIGDEVGFHRIDSEPGPDLDDLDPDPGYELALDDDYVPDAIADRAQAAIDSAVAEAERLDDLVTGFDPDSGHEIDPYVPFGEGEATFISELPSAAMASDLAADSDNRMGRPERSLGELLEPEQPLVPPPRAESPKRIHGLRDFVFGDEPQDEMTSPIGVDLDETLAALEASRAQQRARPPGRTAPPPIPVRRPPSPEDIEVDLELDSIDVDVDIAESLRAAAGEPIPTPIAASPSSPLDRHPLQFDPIVADDGPLPGADLEADDGDDKKKKGGFFKRIFRKD